VVPGPGGLDLDQETGRLEEGQAVQDPALELPRPEVGRYGPGGVHVLAGRSRHPSQPGRPQGAEECLPALGVGDVQVVQCVTLRAASERRLGLGIGPREDVPQDGHGELLGQEALEGP